MEKTMAFLSQNIGPVALSAVLFILVLALGFVLGTVIQKARLHSIIKKERADAVKKSRAVLAVSSVSGLPLIFQVFRAIRGMFSFLALRLTMWLFQDMQQERK